jgi:hypothetical protein
LVGGVGMPHVFLFSRNLQGDRGRSSMLSKVAHVHG